jgi:hypothetical protein
LDWDWVLQGGTLRQKQRLFKSEKEMRLMGKKLVQRCMLMTAGLVMLTLAGAGPAEALRKNFGDDVVLDFDVTLKYSAAWRAEKPDPFLVDGDPSHPLKLGSWGDGNFDQGDMINNRVSVMADIDLQYKEDYGLFLRPRGYYDAVYDKTGGDNGGDEFFSETRDLHADKVELLDSFVYGQFDVGERPASLRIGKHVVSWGESLAILNSVSTAMSPLDATAANVPGTELKEILLPVWQVSGDFGLTDSLTIAAFYQWEWDKNRLDETGSYFSTNNLLDDGVRESNLGFLRGDDKDPSDDGQWGVALRFLPEALEGTEFGLYFINYHEKMPYVENAVPLLYTFVGVPPALGAGTYNLGYSDNVKLYGASVSSMISDTNVALEVTYRQDLAVQVVQTSNLQAVVPALAVVDTLVNTSGSNWENVDADVLQVQASSISIMPQSPLYDNMIVTAEVGVNHVTSDLNGKSLMNDRTAWGGLVKASFDYYQIVDQLDLNVPITFKFNPHNTSSVLGTFAEDNDSIGSALNFTYKSVYKLGLGYVHYLADVDEDKKADRDFYSLNLIYTF